MNDNGEKVNIFKSNKPGPEAGFKLIISYINIDNRVSLNIRNQSEKVNENKNIYISPGTYTDIPINRVYINRLGPPYSDCKSEVSLELNETRSFPYKQNYW